MPDEDEETKPELPKHQTFDGPALGKLNAMADRLRAADPSLTAAQAFTKVYTDPNNRDLVRREYQERMARAS